MGRAGGGGPARSILPERRPAPADRGPVRLRRRARVLRIDGAADARGRRDARRRLLRDDAGTHRGDARPRSTARSQLRDGRASAPPRRRRRAGSRSRRSSRRRRRPRPTAVSSRPPPTPLLAKLREGRFVVSVEIDPPRSIRIDRTIEAARAPARRRRRPRQHQRLGDGPRPDGRDGRRVRHPARPRPRVPRPLHDPRPEPDGDRIGAARRPRARRPEHPRADRRPAADRRLPGRERRLGRRLDRPRRGPRPAQPRRGPGRLPDRPAGRVHDRLRARPDRRRRRDRVGPPRAEARGRRGSRHDPAALLGSARSRRCSPRLGGGSARPASRSRCSSASCRSRAPATPSSSTTRCPASRSRTRRGPRCTTPANAARRSGSSRASRSSRQVGDAVSGTYIMPSFGRYEQCAELVRRIRARAAAPDRDAQARAMA